MEQCSFDARSGGATWPPSCGEAFRSGWSKKAEDEKGRGRSMRAVKDSPVTRLFQNNLRTSGRKANMIGHPTARTSPRIRSIRDGVDKKQRGNSARSTRAVEEPPSPP